MKGLINVGAYFRILRYIQNLLTGSLKKAILLADSAFGQLSFLLVLTCILLRYAEIPLVMI